MMKLLEYNHYVYLIANIVNHKKYIGVRSCKIDPIDDIGVKYFSSSSDAEFMIEQKETDNFTYEILGYFDDRQTAELFENKLLKIYNVVDSKMFYNKARNISTGIYTGLGRKVSIKTREKLRKAKLGVPNSKDWQKAVDGIINWLEK